MKILLVADRLAYTGRTTYALSLARGIKEARSEVQFVLAGGDLRSRLTDLGIEHYILKHNIFSFRRLLSFLREFGPEIVHVVSEQALRPGRRVARGLRMGYVVTVNDLLEAQDLRLRPGEVQAVIVGNEGLREALVNRLGVPKQQIRLIPKGVDLATFDLERVAFAGRLPVIACIGRMVPGKGHEDFLRAARQVLDAPRAACFVLIGQGPEERRARRLIRDLDLRPHVTISSPIPSTRELFRLTDILVLPATKAASSTTALEAMAARRPIIASLVGDLLHLVKNEENALAVEPGNVEGLARAILRLIDDQGFAQELGERARQFVSAKYPLSRMVEATTALYEEVRRGDFPRP